jgi:hypothetical protein
MLLFQGLMEMTGSRASDLRFAITVLKKNCQEKLIRGSLWEQEGLFGWLFRLEYLFRMA